MQDLCLALASARALVDDPARSAQAHTVVSAGERALHGARHMVGALAADNSLSAADALEASVRTAARDKQFSFAARGVAATAQLDAHRQNALVHIAREAVTNAVKHAGACAIEVLFAYGKEWRLTVRDDGCGFDGARPGDRGTSRGALTATHAQGPGVRPEDAGGFGLASMRRQAESLGGALSVRSGSHGTTVEALIP
jgi:signal transduction histidine kinase